MLRQNVVCVQDLFRNLEASRSLLLAVSGGPDSLALLLLVDRWRQGREIAVAVATVDHRLRAGSDDEAAQVAALCAARDLPHHILTRDGAPFRTRIQERARDARYRLLVACARRIGADTLVTGHHADDQAETVLMRLTRGSGIGGLAAMAEVSRRDGLALARPLLGMRKAELAAICEAEGVSPVDDPANTDPAFRRTALRELAQTFARQGLGVPALQRLSVRAARAEAALDWALAQARVASALDPQVAQSSFCATAFAGVPRELQMRLIAGELARLVPGADPRLERLEALTDRVAAALGGTKRFAATLAGGKIEVDGSMLRITRAPARRDTAAAPSPYLCSAACLGNAAPDA